MDYIAEALVDAGFDVEIVSPSWSVADRGIYPGEAVAINDHKRVIFAPSVGTRRGIVRKLAQYLSHCWLVVWLVVNVRRNEAVVVYHSLAFMRAILLAKAIKGFRMVLEIEEIYCDVTPMPPAVQRRETKMIAKADAMLLSTDMLVRRIDLRGRCHAVVYGEYIPIPRRVFPSNDGRIHLVYAGSIDRTTGGAFIALEAARHLSERYVLHILGYPLGIDIEEFAREVEQTRRDTSCGIIYAKVKHGLEYVDYMQKCHIGLSTRTLHGKFLASSFPSKVMSYLCLGLRVVSCDLESVRRSAVGDLVSYYAQDDPREIAAVIGGIDVSAKFDPASRIRALHEDFVARIHQLVAAAPGGIG